MNNNTESGKKVEGSDIASSVLSRIKKEGVTPTPRSHFLLREGVVWSLGGVSVLLGALGAAAIIFTARYSEWQYYDATHDNFFTFLADIMPYTWIFGLILFAIIAYESVRHTKRGYRYQLPVLVIGSVGASIVLGSVVYAFGAGPYIDRQVGSYIPLHQSLRDTKLAMWNQPERGIISGIVTDISLEEDEFTLQSPSNEMHTIRMDTLPPRTRKTVVVGETMRVFAPLIEEEYDEELEGADDDMMMASDVAEDDASLAISSESSADATTMMMTAPAPDSRMMKSATFEMEADNAIEEMKPLKRSYRFLRNACFVMPFNDDGAVDEVDHRKEVEDCLKTFRAKSDKGADLND